MFKSIHLVGEEFGLQVDRNEDSEAIVFRLNDFILDKEKSKPEHTFFKECDVLEVYPTIDDVKEIIKALQQILLEDEANE